MSGEDIALCVDVDVEVQSEMKLQGSNGQLLTRLDAVKQALLLFVHSKLGMGMGRGIHRCAIATMAQVASWHLHPYTSNLDVITRSVRSLSAQGSFSRCDVSSLLKMVARDAQNAVQQGRCLRVIFVYCRSCLVPVQDDVSCWPITLDVLYLHDKPSPGNCPQRAYDALVDIVERLDAQQRKNASRGYIYETGMPLARVYFKLMALLLLHPQQRCAQEDFGAPRDLLPPPVPPLITVLQDASCSSTFS